MTKDPRRLSDDPTKPELARALRGARGDVLSPEAVARVRAALVAGGIGAWGGAGAGHAGHVGPRSPMARLLTTPARLWVGLAGIGLAGVAVAAMRHTPSHPGPPFPPPDQAVATAWSAPVTATPAPPETPEPVAASPTFDPLPATMPTATTMETSRAKASARPPATGETPTKPPAAAAAPSPREGALLLEARRALGTDPVRALTLVRAHALEFPASQLAPERARIAAEARQRLQK